MAKKNKTIQKVITLQKILDLHLKENILSNATISKYKSVVKVFIKQTGIKDTNALTHDAILTWRDDILNRSSAGNWNNYHRHLRALLQTAVELDLIKTNPFKKIKAVTHYPTKQHLLNKEEIKALYVYCSQTEYGWFWSSVITTLRYTGIRRRQLVGLTWDDLDLEKKCLILRAGSSKTKREYTIPIGNEVIKSILFVKDKINYKDNHNPYVKKQIFNITRIKPRYQANKMNEEHIARFFVKASKVLGFTVSAHRFRHIFATTLANNPNVNIKTVQNLLGHSSVHTTLGYVHPNLNDMRDAVDLLS